MPELLSRYPDDALKVLREGGGKCGIGAQPKILTSCPRGNFCLFPTGEICVYGLRQIDSMTQISKNDISAPTFGQYINLFDFIILGFVFMIGLVVGTLLRGGG